MRVLVVDDDPDLGLLVELFLRRAGHDVLVAGDGVIALGLLAQAETERRPVDLIVLDQMMPRLDGLGLTRAVRQDPGLSGIPLLMMSAHHERDVAMDAGVDAFIGKPFTSTALLAAVDAVTVPLRRPDVALPA